MASKWPAWVVLYDDRMRRASDPYEAFSLGDDNWPWRVSLEKECGMYLHRDAARAWQAFRDWLNGTAEQWKARVDATPRISINGGSQVSIGGVYSVELKR